MVPDSIGFRPQNYHTLYALVSLQVTVKGVIKVRPYVGLRYVRYFFPDNVHTVRVRYFAVGCRTLTSLYDENKLYVSYVQPKFTKVSTVWNCLPPSVNYSTLATFRHSTRTLFFPITYVQYAYVILEGNVRSHLGSYTDYTHRNTVEMKTAMFVHPRL